MGVILQNRSRTGVGNRTFNHAFDSLSFAFIGHNIDDNFALADLRNTHAESVGGNSIKGGEPAFAQLLITAGIIKFHNQEGFVGIKVSRGVIESDVTIFTNTDKSDVDGVIGKDFLHLGAECGRIIGIAFNKIYFCQLAGQLVDEVFPQVQTETGFVALFTMPFTKDVKAGDQLGFDIRYNDAAPDGVRRLMNFCDASDTGWNDPTVFGLLELTK